MFPCAAYLNGEYGMKDIYLGVPVILGREGVERVVEIKLTKEERAQLKESCSAVKKLVKKLSILILNICHSVIPACRESFRKERFWTSQNDRHCSKLKKYQI